MKKIAVLLSSYNGGDFIEKLIKSLLKQEEVNVNIYIRDDGSSDNTLNILNKFKKNNPNIKIDVNNNNIGYKKSFSELLESIKYEEFDYVAFCDQDDYWEPRKLIEAVNMMEVKSVGIPLGYGSNLKIVDENLNFVKMMYQNFTPETVSLESNLINGYVYGCTLVFNKKAYEQILKFERSDEYAFDYYIPIVIKLLGVFIWDNNSFILYRQHSSNVIGASRSLKQQYKNSKAKPKNFYSNFCTEILRVYKLEKSNPYYYVLEKYSKYLENRSIKKNILLDKNTKKNTIKGTLNLKMLILRSKF